MIDLRDYQRDIVERARLVRRPCVVMPTGSGKTLVASEIIRGEADRHVLFLAHRRELIHQAAAKLGEVGVNAGVILAGEPTNAMSGVQIASVQTLWSRSFRSKSLELPPADIVFIDEAHHVRAHTYKAIIEKYPDAKIIGLTATPCRRDGRGLGNVFDALVEGPQVPELIAQGFLVGTKVFAPSKPDLKGVHTRQGDYVESELAERMDKVELVGDIVSHWHRLSERRKTVVFATSVAHSVHLKDEFERSGVRAEHIDGSTPKGERDEILAEFARGDLKVVTNCAVLTEGWDSPSVSCIVLARPTKSPGLFRQMVGRVLRPYPGKGHALVLDHAGAVFQHGFVEDPVIWTLDADKRTETPSQAARQLQPSSRLLECSQCSAIRAGGQACPQCGFLPAVQANISTCATAISSKSGAMESRSPMSGRPNCATSFTDSSSAWPCSAGTNPVGPRINISRSLATGRRTPMSSRWCQNQRSRHGCGRARSPTPRRCRRRDEFTAMVKRRTGRERFRKSYEGWRRKYVGDLRHMLQCCIYNRLPEANREYLEHILRDELNLPLPAEVAKRVHFTNEQREANRLWTIPPVDMTKEQLAEQRREKDRRRKMLARRKAHIQSREAYLASVAGDKPWIKVGKPRSTWFRHQAKTRGERLALGSSGPQNGGVRLGVSASLIE